MKERDLRRFFLHLAAFAAPAQLLTGGCGGTVVDDHQNPDNSEAGGMGGYPVFQGQPPSGGYPMYQGAGAGNYGPSGGYPTYVGSGGVPVFLGVGDSGVRGGAGGTLVGADASVLDAGMSSPCAAGPPFGACVGQPYCVAMPAVPSDGGLDCVGLCTVLGYTTPFCSSIEWRGERVVQCRPSCTGRRPAGLGPTPGATGGDVCAYFQEMARLEAASVPAFRTLARELGLHGAPRSLRRAARRAARDEIRHARLGKLLAERFGGRYTPPRITAKPVRSLEELATDNAVEGCVRETFGAVIATYQARASADPVVRRILRAIAVDETRHAAIAIRVAKWVERRLEPAARERVRAARRAAAKTVLSELAFEPSAQLVHVAGVPSGETARALARAVEARLWA